MDLFVNGVLLGLTLSILVGPIIFALIQTAIERGFRAGAMVGLGVWVSDLFYICVAYFGVSHVVKMLEWEGFEEILGTVGGLVLIGFGIGTFLSKPPKLPGKKKKSSKILNEQLPKLLDFKKYKVFKNFDYGALWLKGFLINTLNPFTVFFWAGVVSTMVIGQEMNDRDAVHFFGGILGTIIMTDTLKIWAAKAVRHLLKPGAVLLMRRISGGALAVFGVALIVRVFWFSV